MLKGMRRGRNELKFIIVIKAFDLAREIVKAGSFIGAAYFAYRAIEALAGRQTDAKLIFSYLTSNENDFGLPWIMTFGAFIYAYAERRLRCRKTEYFQGRITELEKRLDPNRSTSGLLPTGDTHPEDRK